MSVQFDFTKLTDSINKTTSAIEKLDKNINKMSTNVSGFNRLFGNTKKFDEFIESVLKLNNASSANFKVIADGITSITNALAAVPATAKLNSVVTQITKLVESLNGLKTTKASANRITDFITTTTTQLNVLFKRISKIGSTPDVEQAIQRIQKVFNVISGLKAASPVNIQATIQIIKDIYTALSNFPKVPVDPATLDSISVASKKIERTFISLGKVASIKTDITAAVQQLSLVSTAINNIHPVDKSMLTTLDAIKKSMSIITTIPKAPSQGIGQNQALLADLFDRNITNKIRITGPGNIFGLKPSDFELAQKNIKDNITLLDGINKQISVAVTHIPNTDAISSLGRGLKSIAAFTNSLKKIDTSSFKSSYLDRLPLVGPFFRRISRVFDPSVIEKVGISIRSFSEALGNIQVPQGLGNAFAGIGTFINSIGKLDITNVKSSVFTRLPVIGRVFKSIGDIFQPSVLRQVGVALKQLSETLKGSQIPEIGNEFAGLGRFLNSINKIDVSSIKSSVLSRLPLVGRLFTGLGNIFKPSKFRQVSTALRQLANSFKGIVIPDFSNLLPSISSFIEDSKNINFKDADMKGFSSFTKQLADGLKNLNKVNIDPAKLNAIAAALSGVTKFRSGLGSGGFSDLPPAAAKASRDASTQTTSAVGSIIQTAIGVFIAKVAYAALSKVGDFVKKLINFGTSIRNALNQIGQSISAFGQRAQYLGNQLVNNFGLEKLANSQVVQIAADFDHLSNSVQTFGQLTDEETKRAQDFADQIGIKYPLSANDALQATLDLIKAGQDLNSIEFILPNAADLAALGDIDVTTSTKALIQATASFDYYSKGIEATFDNIDVAANQFSAAADVSTASVSELIEGISNVGPAANLAGLNLQQTLAILDQFNDAGVRGAEAGTQLRQVLTTLRSDKAVDELAALQRLSDQAGIDINLSLANTDGTLRDFDEVVRNLAGAYEHLGFTQEQMLDSIGELTGIRSQQGLAILLGNKGFQGVIDKINSMATAEQRAVQLLDDFRGDVEQLKGSMETLNKNAFIPIIRQAFRPFVQLARYIVDGILEIGKANPQLYDFIGNVVILSTSLATIAGSALIAFGVLAKFEGLLFRLGASFIGLVTNLPALIAGVAGFVGALGTLLVAVTAIGAAIGAAALVFGGFKDVIERNIGGAGDAFNKFRRTVEFVLSRINPFLRQVARTLNLVFGNTAQDAVDGFGGRVSDFFDRLTAFAFNVDQTVQQVGALFENFATFIEMSFGVQSTDRIAFFEDQLRKLSSFPLIKTLFGANANPRGLKAFFKVALDLFNGLRDSVSDIFSGAIGVLFGEKDATAKLNKGVSTFLSTILGLVQSITNIDLGRAILSFNMGDIGAGINALMDVVINGIRQWFIQNRSAIITAIGDVLSFGISAAFGAADFILRLLGLDNAASTARDIGRTVSNIIKQAVNFVIQLASGGTLIDLSGGQKIIESIIGDPAMAIQNLANGIKDIVVGALGSLPALLQQAGTTLGLQPLIDLGLTLQDSQAFTQITDGLANLVSYPFEAAGKMFEGIKALFESGNLANALGIAAVFTAITAAGGIAPAISLIAGSIKGLLLGAALPAFGIITLVEALGNIDELLQGNVGGFIVHTLTDIASSILSFFGVEMSGDTIIDRVGQALIAAGDTLPALFAALGDKLTSAIGGVLEQITARITIFLDDIKSLPVLGQKDFGDAFRTARFELGGTNAEGIFAALTNGSLGESDVRALAITSVDNIMRAIGDVIDRHPDINSIPDELFSQIARVLDDSGLVDKAAESIDAGPVRDAFYERIQFELARQNIDLPIQADVTITPKSIKFSSGSEAFLSHDSILNSTPEGNSSGAAAFDRLTGKGKRGAAGGGKSKTSSDDLINSLGGAAAVILGSYLNSIAQNSNGTFKLNPTPYDLDHRQNGSGVTWSDITNFAGSAALSIISGYLRSLASNSGGASRDEALAGLSPEVRAALENGGTYINITSAGGDGNSVPVDNSRPVPQSPRPTDQQLLERSLSFGNVVPKPENYAEISEKIVIAYYRALSDAFRSTGQTLSSSESKQLLTDLLAGSGAGLDEGNVRYIVGATLGGTSSFIASSFYDEIQNALNSYTGNPIELQPVVKVTPLSVDISNFVSGITEKIRSFFNGRLSIPQAVGLGLSLSRNIQGRANGGELKPNSQYGVHDTPHPEVAMFNDGTSMLFTGSASGRMVKLIGMAAAPAFTLDDFIRYRANQGQTTDLASVTKEDITAARQAVKDEKKKKKDSKDQIDKINTEIADAELKAFTDAAEIRKKFTDDTLKAEEAFNHERRNILTEGRESLLDAIRRGDGASALSTVRNVKKQLEEQKYQFDLAKTEREAQLADQLHQNEESRKERLADYAKQLQELKDQNEAEAQEQEEANQDQLVADEAINRSLAAQRAAAAAKQKSDLDAAVKTMTNIYFFANQNLISAANGFGILAQGVRNFIDQINAKGIAAAVGRVIDSGGKTTISDAVGSVINAGFPKNPRRGDVFRDPSNRIWFWDGSQWNLVPGRASGGPLDPYSVYRIHDTSKPEFARLGNQSMLFTGANSGRVVPLPRKIAPPGYGPTTQGNVYLSVNLGDIVSNATDPALVAQEVRNAILPEVRSIVEKAGTATRRRTLMDLG